MKDNKKEIWKKLLDIFLTALASSLIAFLQQYLSNKVGDTGIEKLPEQAGLIGGSLALLKNVKAKRNFS